MLLLFCQFKKIFASTVGASINRHFTYILTQRKVYPVEWGLRICSGKWNLVLHIFPLNCNFSPDATYCSLAIFMTLQLLGILFVIPCGWIEKVAEGDAYDDHIFHRPRLHEDISILGCRSYNRSTINSEQKIAKSINVKCSVGQGNTKCHGMEYKPQEIQGNEDASYACNLLRPC